MKGRDLWCLHWEVEAGWGRALGPLQSSTEASHCDLLLTDEPVNERFSQHRCLMQWGKMSGRDGASEEGWKSRASTLPTMGGEATAARRVPSLPQPLPLMLAVLWSLSSSFRSLPSLGTIGCYILCHKLTWTSGDHFQSLKLSTRHYPTLVSYLELPRDGSAFPPMVSKDGHS